LRVFAEKGFKGATLKGIAREAGIKSPALIYWYFKDKEALFRAVAEESSPVVRWAAAPGALMERLPDEVLPLVANSYFDTFDDPAVVRVLRILLSEAALDPEGGGQPFAGSQRNVLDFFTAYLERQVELGRLKRHDPESAARAFFGTLVVYVLNREIFTQLKEGLPERERYVRSTVALFLDGLRA
jgi:TetR/AcrR family transcriptional regulator